MADDEGSWVEYKKLILAELERLSAGIASLNAKIDLMRSDDIAQIKAEVAVLKFKSGLWGAAFGAIPSAIAVIYIFATK
jgi:hypothetical protein